MKTAFNILPQRTGNEELHLLVETGSYGISFLWFTKDPYAVRGIAAYNFTDKNQPSEMAREIQNILNSVSIFNEPNISVTICYDFKESLLVPETYYKPASAEAMLNLVYATDADSNYKTQHINGLPVYNVYAIDNKIETVLSEYFPGASVHHATSLQLEHIPVGEKCIYCIFFHNSIKVFMFNVSAVEMVQQFSYNTPVDASYHLLNCCEQHDIKPSDIKLLLSGMIDEKSKLYTELYRYFLNIEFEKTAEGVELHDSIISYPTHFFSHLTELALCVS